jgi:NADP-reducing hydrogenase subunit HndD
VDRQTIVMDGREISFEPGQTILEAGEEHGIHIPTLCFLKGASPTGACRICLVELEGAKTLVAACATPAAANMVVRTDSPRVVNARRLNLELLLASGHHNCLAKDGDLDSWTDTQLHAMTAKGHEDLCPAYGSCRLQDLAIRYQASGSRFETREPAYEIEDVNPLIVRDFSRCILCGRCVQACNELQVNRAISFGYRGSAAKIVAAGDRPLINSDCVFCGECVQACPVGALIEKKARTSFPASEVEKIRTTCPYCGVGCQLWLHVKENRIVKVTGVQGAEPNQGRLCVKGRFGYDFIYSEDRLRTPLIRKHGTLREASWDEALDLVVRKMKEVIAQSGPDAVAGVSCARSINEDSYQMQKLFRAVIGTNNIDHCART